MKKFFIVVFVTMLISLISGCHIRYDKINEKIKHISFEEYGYVFFTSNEIIDDQTSYHLTDIFENLLINNDISYDFLNFEYQVTDDALFALVNYLLDEEGYFYQAFVIYDFIDHNILSWELLPPTVSVNNSNYYLTVDDNQYVLVYSMQEHLLSVYTIEDGIVNKEDFMLSDDEGLVTDYFVKDNTFVRLNYEEVFDAFHYLNHEVVAYEISDFDILYRFHETINQNDETYDVYITDMLTIKNSNDDVYFESELFSLYETSYVGIEVNQIVEDMTNADYKTALNRFDVYVSSTHIYIAYQYNQGFLMNTSLLGETPCLIFRFDFETNSLKYIGLQESFIAVYQK